MAPSTLIIGGSGKVAKHITRLLASAPHSHAVHSIIRSEAHIPSLRALGANPILQSLETSSPAELAETMAATRASTVIFSAGAGGGDPARTEAVDHRGAVKAMDACALAGVKRFVLVSAVDVRDVEKGGGEPEWYDAADRERSAGMREALGPYMAAKLAADRELVVGNERRGLEFTIVRPGRLSEEAGQGRVEAGKVHLSRAIAREDVAAVVVRCLAEEGTKGLAFDVVGGETPIEEALAKVARERIDTFQGRF